MTEALSSTKFFGRVLRMMAELPCGLVVAVHDDYLGTPGYRQAEGFLEQRIMVPELPDPATLARLITHRVTTVDDGASFVDVFQAGALEALFGYYEGAGARSLRKVFQTAQTAMSLVDQAATDHVTAHMIESAISEWN